MPKIDNIVYPHGDEELLKNKELGIMYRVFLKKRAAAENFMFLDVCVKKMDPKKQYAVYFDDNGKFSVNLATKEKQLAKQLAEAGDWKNRAWKSIYDTSRRVCNEHLVQNFADDFYKSPAFKAYHAEALRRAIRIPKAFKDQVGVKDDKVLVDTVVLFMTDKNAGQKAAKSLASKKKITCSPAEFGKSVAKFFKLR